jgi:hypothetical protein
MGLTAAISTNLTANLTCARSLVTASGPYKDTANISFDSATRIYTSATNVATSKVIDLHGGLLDVLGDKMTMSAVSFLRIRNLSTTSAINALGGATDIPIVSSASGVTINPQHTHDFNMSPGDLQLTEGSADTITITGTSRFEIVVIGRL